MLLIQQAQREVGVEPELEATAPPGFVPMDFNAAVDSNSEGTLAVESASTAEEKVMQFSDADLASTSDPKRKTFKRSLDEAIRAFQVSYNTLGQEHPTRAALIDAAEVKDHVKRLKRSIKLCDQHQTI